MRRLGLFALLVVLLAQACDATPPPDAFQKPVDGCHLLNDVALTALSSALPETPATSPQPADHPLSYDWTFCRHEYGTPPPRSPDADPNGPDITGTPAYRHVSLDLFRYTTTGDRRGDQQALYWLKSYPGNVDWPDAKAIGLDGGTVHTRPNGIVYDVEVHAVIGNLAISLVYGGSNTGSRPPGMPPEEAKAGAIRLATDIASERPCPTDTC
jgi:hypothetical protein